MSYTKLFSHIVTSSIWSEDDQTRILWITMLALADKHGEVMASVPGLAKVAGLTIESTQKGLEKFLSPDPFSRTPDDEGRRIEVIDGGWLIINYAKHRRMASLDEQREKNAERQRRFRERKSANSNALSRTVTDESRGSNSKVTHKTDNAEAEADAETSLRKSGASSKSKPTTEEFIAELKANPAYKGINIERERGKMEAWCKEKGKQPTRMRFINWLNRTETPFESSTTSTPKLRSASQAYAQ